MFTKITPARNSKYENDRSIDVHLKSIRVENRELIQGKQVLVLDDVQTTGNSLQACLQLITEAGAAIARSLSIANTVGY